MDSFRTNFRPFLPHSTCTFSLPLSDPVRCHPLVPPLEANPAPLGAMDRWGHDSDQMWSVHHSKTRLYSCAHICSPLKDYSGLQLHTHLFFLLCSVAPFDTILHHWAYAAVVRSSLPPSLPPSCIAALVAVVGDVLDELLTQGITDPNDETVFVSLDNLWHRPTWSRKTDLPCCLLPCMIGWVVNPI